MPLIPGHKWGTVADTNENAAGYIVLTGIVEREGDQFVSQCPQLGVASCGDTIEEAFDNLGDALQVHLNALEEIGELERVIQENHIE